jgi:hypothetical protein
VSVVSVVDFRDLCLGIAMINMSNSTCRLVTYRAKLPQR